MSGKKYLIVNADDFGRSSGVNRGVITAHEQGIVTSASFMVRWPAAVEAAAYARPNPRLSVGLHLDLGEWTYSNGTWHVVYQVVPNDNAAAVEQEVGRQLETFRQLMGRNPTHLDSHQHIHRSEPVHSLLRRTARELGVVLRDDSSAVQYCGDFYGQADKAYPTPEAITVEALIRVINNLVPGTTELACHPAENADLDSMYQSERLVELQTLCDPRVRAAIEAGQIVLCSFAEHREIMR